MTVDDLVIEMFADQIADLERDVVTYRLIAQQTLHALHALTVKHDRLHGQYLALVQRSRELRMRRQGAA